MLRLLERHLILSAVVLAFQAIDNFVETGKSKIVMMINWYHLLLRFIQWLKY